MYFDGDYEITEHDDYTEVDVQSNNTRLWLEDGDTVENYLIRTNGNYFNVQARADGWTIRNFAVDGELPDHFGALFSLAATNGSTCRLENVYMGDGGAGDWRDKHQGDGRNQPTGSFTFSNHTGRIEYVNVYARNWTDNCFYNGNQGGDAGELYWENCYVAESNISAFRIRNNNAEMRNCVTADNTHRDVWVRGSGTLDIYDSDLGGTVVHSGNGTINLHDTRAGSLQEGNGTINIDSGSSGDPQHRVPDGCPTEPMEAVIGSSDDDEDEADDGNEENDENDENEDEDVAPWTAEYGVVHIYEVEATGDEHVDYFIQSQDAPFEYLDYDDAVVDADRQWTAGDKCAGRVEPGTTHCVGFDEPLIDVTIDPENAADARVNGEESSLDWYPRDDADGDEWKDIDELLDLDDGALVIGDDEEMSSILNDGFDHLESMIITMADALTADYEDLEYEHENEHEHEHEHE